jgi:hypothetical protein
MKNKKIDYPISSYAKCKGKGWEEISYNEENK